MKKVLIAHQSTIPHYRVPFYNALERLKPDNWCFEVVFDPSEIENRRFFKEPLDIKQFKFPILAVNTIAAKIAGKNISYQTFLKKAAEYDLIIVEQVLHNVSYFLCHLHQLTGVKLAYWGHGKHAGAKNNSSLLKNLSEQLKTQLTIRADGFFAYTSRGKSFVVDKGFSPDNVFVLNNTVDINIQRQAFEKFKEQREEISRMLGVADKKVLLLVGRFSKTKRIEFLLEAFSIIQKKDANFHLLLVGSGGEKYLPRKLQNVSYFGPITNLDKLAPIYVAADVFSFPGSVGLGPLQALCYDLPVITIDSDIHPPEIEYLSPKNSIILPSNSTPEDYALTISKLFEDAKGLQKLKAGTWMSIKHLTIERMAQNFIEGVNSLLN
ncbi:MAG: glycosyltransferase family 4 protein [Xenococcaceae cyanobacterium MO_188.B29]|nr:glycosyltransferase family 4 protein [Xenococcaceae cyanobacterium MO_188.B29]